MKSFMLSIRDPKILKIQIYIISLSKIDCELDVDLDQ